MAFRTERDVIALLDKLVDTEKKVDLLRRWKASDAPPRPETVEVPAELLTEAARYLEDLEDNMLRNDADMRLDDCLPPRFYADQLRVVLSARPTAAETGVTAHDDDPEMGSVRIGLRTHAAEQAELASLRAKLAEAERQSASYQTACSIARVEEERRREAEATIAAHARRIAELEAGLRPAAEVPAHGEYGGSMVVATILYEDETDERAGKYAGLSSNFFRRARALLSSPQGEADAEGGKDG